MGMTQEAAEARRNYQRDYRHRNRDRINSRRKQWCAENRDKVREYNQSYWERKAEGGNIRLPLSAYGITSERHKELVEIVRSGRYAGMVLDAALKADRLAAGHIIMSVRENASYETLEAKQAAGKIERIALGRTDFYGARRLFFHYLDMALKGIPEECGVEVENG